MTSFEALFTPVRGRLLLLLGLAPTVACGAKVVFVGEGDGGAGQGGGANTGAGTTSTGGSPAWCPDPVGLRNVCFQSNTCPDRQAMELPGLIEAALMSDLSCTNDPQFCGCDWTVNKIGCGPDPEARECCYLVDVTAQEICEGRPFTIGGHAEVATPIASRDWITQRARLDATSLTHEEREALGAAWLESALYEHASIASFARFTLELLALGAPPDLLRDTQRAMGDEVAHAAACFELAASLLGRDAGPGALPIQGALEGRADAATIVEAAVREGCIGETISALGAVLARDQASDPAVRAALAAIAEDELRHAELSWRFVGWALARDLPGARDAARRAFAAGPASPRAEEPELVAPATARAFGMLPAVDRAALACDAWRALIAPTAAALLARPTQAAARPTAAGDASRFVAPMEPSAG